MRNRAGLPNPNGEGGRDEKSSHSVTVTRTLTESQWIGAKLSSSIIIHE